MLSLRFRGGNTAPLEVEWLSPDGVAGLSAGEIAQRKIFHGNRQEPLGEFFDVSGDAADEDILIRGDCRRVKWLGARMCRGRMTIEGSVGMHVGSGMVGGELIVLGDADDWAGAEMRGGLLRIAGNAGHALGAAYRGSRVGMRGGVILVHGSAGNEVGSHMRRGFIAVGQSVGDFAGVGMIAGSIFVFGTPGIRIGAGMKRGSIVCLGPASALSLLPTFRYDCRYQPVFLRLYLLRLAQLGWSHVRDFLDAWWDRYSGDLVELGKGEILQRVGASPKDRA
ncbi:MAG: formylmethanofuran dehydrogenase subunit C [Gemmataceae bacterium]